MQHERNSVSIKDIVTGPVGRGDLQYTRIDPEVVARIARIEEKLDRLLASAIEAATAGETVEQGSTVGESAVGKAETPKGGHHG